MEYVTRNDLYNIIFIVIINAVIYFKLFKVEVSLICLGMEGFLTRREGCCLCFVSQPRVSCDLAIGLAL